MPRAKTVAEAVEDSSSLRVTSRCQVNCFLAIFDRLCKIFKLSIFFIPCAETVAKLVEPARVFLMSISDSYHYSLLREKQIAGRKNATIQVQYNFDWKLGNKDCEASLIWATISVGTLKF